MKRRVFQAEGLWVEEQRERDAQPAYAVFRPHRSQFLGSRSEVFAWAKDEAQAGFEALEELAAWLEGDAAGGAEEDGSEGPSTTTGVAAPADPMVI